MENNFSIEKFSPAKAEVMRVVGEAKSVDITNIEQVHEKRIALRDTRIDIAKSGKMLRENALKFQKDVIAIEKELIDMLTPDEERLDAIEAEHKLRIEMEKRRVELPNRLAGLSAIGDNVTITDDELLKMNDNDFNVYRLMRIENKLTADRIAFEKKQEEDKEAERLRQKAIDDANREQLEKDRAELAAARKIQDDKIAAENLAIAVEKARIDGIKEQQAKDEEAKRKEAERIANEQKQKDLDEAHRMAEENFNIWLKQIGHDSKTDKIEPSVNGTMIVWRKIGTYNPTK